MPYLRDEFHPGIGVLVDMAFFFSRGREESPMAAAYPKRNNIHEKQIIKTNKTKGG
jgi:hypothetical protein